MKRFIVILLIFVPLLGSAQEKIDVSKHDGNSWRSMNYIRQLDFVAGFILGSFGISSGCRMPENVFMKEGSGYSETKGLKVLADYWTPKKQYTREEVGLLLEGRMQFFNSSLDKYGIIGITNDQLVDGLNKFYEDFRNRGILLGLAILVVKKQIKGASQEEIEAVCEYIRSDYDFKKLKYKNKDGTITYAEFP
jgi:hypothetical protein